MPSLKWHFLARLFSFAVSRRKASTRHGQYVEASVNNGESVDSRVPVSLTGKRTTGTGLTDIQQRASSVGDASTRSVQAGANEVSGIEPWIDVSQMFRPPTPKEDHSTQLKPPLVELQKLCDTRDDANGKRIYVGNSRQNYCRQREVNRSIIDALLPAVRTLCNAQSDVEAYWPSVKDIIELCDSLAESNMALAKQELKTRKAEEKLLKTEIKLQDLESELYGRWRSLRARTASSISSVSGEQERLERHDYALISVHSQESDLSPPLLRAYRNGIDDVTHYYDRVVSFDVDDSPESAAQTRELISDYLGAKDAVYELRSQCLNEGIIVGEPELPDLNLSQFLANDNEISSARFVFPGRGLPAPASAQVDNWLDDVESWTAAEHAYANAPAAVQSRQYYKNDGRTGKFHLNPESTGSNNLSLYKYPGLIPRLTHDIESSDDIEMSKVYGGAILSRKSGRSLSL